MSSESILIARSGAELPALHAALDRGAAPIRRSAVLLAHGSGVDIEHPWMRGMSNALARRGFLVLRFRYPYMQLAFESGRPRPPDRAPALEEAHFDALAELRRRAPDARWLAAGKSLGGRIATHIAAKGADIHGLVLFGYPLHPPRQRERARSEHFAALAQPALFVHGTRDEFGAPDELARALQRYSGRAELSLVEGGDHSLLARGDQLERALEALAERVADWDSRTFPE